MHLLPNSMKYRLKFTGSIPSVLLTILQQADTKMLVVFFICVMKSEKGNLLCVCMLLQQHFPRTWITLNVSLTFSTGLFRSFRCCFKENGVHPFTPSGAVNTGHLTVSSDFHCYGYILDSCLLSVVS